jgi:hypothetical protein
MKQVKEALDLRFQRFVPWGGEFRSRGRVYMRDRQAPKASRIDKSHFPP